MKNAYCKSAIQYSNPIPPYNRLRRIDKVFFLIDRKDLDDQTVDEYNSFEKDCVDNTDNTHSLVKALKDLPRL